MPVLNQEILINPELSHLCIGVEIQKNACQNSKQERSWSTCLLVPGQAATGHSDLGLFCSRGAILKYLRNHNVKSKQNLEEAIRVTWNQELLKSFHCDIHLEILKMRSPRAPQPILFCPIELELGKGHGGDMEIQNC